MKAFAAAVALFAGAALAHPAALAARDGPCPDLLYSVAQCCSTDVLGVADLDCSTPSSANDAEDLKSSCSTAGAAPKCCTIPVAGLGVLCKDV
ncbi:fungal hydrophobin domain-containing protein [Pochonia chlamydosporia 170]|uniref:Fungal hydrophobin domain-containing protein n=1 Tax=Pochonia chlamydosporia 170 TaxID=1380566 RepID=A0A179F5P4_METCM|nr:fungal hydrophobin domain-containing protein [Pochonia chlamydosporia 170]OAQ60493.1 fungal hydrophobin domain-containing protein [Pochonia chlamydosporia 170]